MTIPSLGRLLLAGLSFTATAEPSYFTRCHPPELERFYARRMGATTTEITSSHVPFISHPEEVARLIEQAATAPTR
ncbi:MAG: hypothetical protein ABI679_11400 [Gemmatimonadota bacterium]